MTAIFPSAAGRICRLERNAIPGDGTAKTLTVPDTRPARRFFRVVTP